MAANIIIDIPFTKFLRRYVIDVKAVITRQDTFQLLDIQHKNHIFVLLARACDVFLLNIPH